MKITKKTVKIAGILILINVFLLGAHHVQANPFGKIEAPAGHLGETPSDDIGNLIGVAIRTVFLVSGLTCLLFMLWGGISWITSSGDQEKLQKAQLRIRNAVIGMVMVILMFGLFIVVFGLVLGNKIIDVKNGFRFIIPSVDDLPNAPCYATPSNPC